jgi:hypothetical protein
MPRTHWIGWSLTSWRSEIRVLYRPLLPKPRSEHVLRVSSFVAVRPTFTPLSGSENYRLKVERILPRRPEGEIPQYLRHASAQARVCIGDCDVYLANALWLHRVHGVGSISSPQLHRKLR